MISHLFNINALIALISRKSDALISRVLKSPPGSIGLSSVVAYDPLHGFHQQSQQAVRLPKPVAFPENVHQVDILKVGRSRVVVPQGKRWNDLFRNGPRVSEDFMTEREQPGAKERQPF